MKERYGVGMSKQCPARFIALVCGSLLIGSAASANEGIDITINDARTLYEGSQSAPGYTNFKVSLSAPATGKVTVKYQTSDGAVNGAKAGQDYVAQSGTLTFLPGQVQKTLRVDFLGDAVAELNETLFVTLSAPTNGTIVDSRGSAYIRNDDGPKIFIDDASAIDEGNIGTRPQVFTVRLSEASTNKVTVHWATAPGSATATDFVPVDSILTFAPGQTSKIIVVQIKGDKDFEDDESYRVQLTDPTFAVVGDSQGNGTIRNDDLPTPVPGAVQDEPSQ